jgi:molybdopterin-guanine dinucleotide biosynthesis protein A
MGRDKAWLELAGRPMIEHVIAALQQVSTSVAVVANDFEYARLGFPVFADSQIGIGPLEAIRTSLRSSTSARALLVGCDLPFVSPELFKFLLSFGDDYDAVVPISAHDKLEPLCAVYCTRALAVVHSLIESGERKVSALFDRVPTRFVRFAELRHLPGSELFFNNVNTPEDYALAVETITKNLRAGPTFKVIP